MSGQHLGISHRDEWRHIWCIQLAWVIGLCGDRESLRVITKGLTCLSSNSWKQMSHWGTLTSRFPPLSLKSCVTCHIPATTEIPLAFCAQIFPLSLVCRTDNLNQGIVFSNKNNLIVRCRAFADMPSSHKLSFVCLNLSLYQLQYERNLSNCAAEQSKSNQTILAGSLINPSKTWVKVLWGFSTLLTRRNIL